MELSSEESSNSEMRDSQSKQESHSGIEEFENTSFDSDAADDVYQEILNDTPCLFSDEILLKMEEGLDFTSQKRMMKSIAEKVSSMVA